MNLKPAWAKRRKRFLGLVLDSGDQLGGIVVSMEADAPVRVRLAGGTDLDGQLQAADPGQSSIRIGSLAQAMPLELARVAAINLPRNPGKTVLNGRAALGGRLASGNTDPASGWRNGGTQSPPVHHDRQADLELRSTLGVGDGQLFERDDLRLAFEGGVSRVNQDFRGVADESFPGTCLAFNYAQALWQTRGAVPDSLDFYAPFTRDWKPGTGAVQAPTDT